jgi:hypothetical protein
VLAQGRDGSTTLHCAANAGTLQSVQILLEHVVDQKQLQPVRLIPLACAAEASHLEGFEFLTNKRNRSTEHPSERDDLSTLPSVTNKNCADIGQLKLVNGLIERVTSEKYWNQLEGLELFHAVKQGYWTVVNKLTEMKIIIKLQLQLRLINQHYAT